jgi:predicted DNA-binding protein (UPF0251 family)
VTVQPLESLRAIARHHLLNMDMLHKRALLLRADGQSDEEAADIEGVSVGTFRSRLGVASSEIAMCLPPGRGLTRELRGAWVQGHLACCLADAVEQLSGSAA